MKNENIFQCSLSNSTISESVGFMSRVRHFAIYLVGVLVFRIRKGPICANRQLDRCDKYPVKTVFQGLY
jgi:hypothetical protein